MAKGVKHYFRDGTEHKGAMHKDAKGRPMSGARHTKNSKYLYHMSELSKTAKKKAKGYWPLRKKRKQMMPVLVR
jgi:hypothetical protein